MTQHNRPAADWEDVRVFLALARHGSLSAAARALSINHATVARRIKSLETALNTKLVDRRRDGYVLTAAGTRALTAASDMEAAAGTLGRRGSNDAPAGLVRVNAPPALAQSYLVPRVTKLPLQYPGLDLDLATDLRPVSLERHETDIAIRLGRLQDRHVVARPLVAMAFGFYGTAPVCRRIEKGTEPVFIGFDEANSQIPDALWLTRHFPRSRIAFRTNNQFAQAIAAGSGCGLVLLPHFIGRTTPGLRTCRLDPVPPPREIWLLTRPQSRNDIPTRTVADYIIRAFAQDRALFE